MNRSLQFILSLGLLAVTAHAEEASQGCKDAAQKLYEKISKDPNTKIDKAMKSIVQHFSQIEQLKLEGDRTQIRAINEEIDRLVKENAASNSDSDKLRNDRLNDLRRQYSTLHTQGNDYLMELLNTKYKSEVAEIFDKIKKEEGVKASIAGNQLQFATLIREDGDNSQYLISRRDYLDEKKEWHGFRVVTKDEHVESISLSHAEFLYPQTMECSGTDQVENVAKNYESTYKYITGIGNNNGFSSGTIVNLNGAQSLQ